MKPGIIHFVGVIEVLFGFNLLVISCSMCLKWGTAREQWMSTLHRYSWVERTQLGCITCVKIHYQQLLLSWTWSFLVSLRRLITQGKLEKVNQSAVIKKLVLCGCNIDILLASFIYTKNKNTDLLQRFWCERYYKCRFI